MATPSTAIQDPNVALTTQVQPADPTAPQPAPTDSWSSADAYRYALRNFEIAERYRTQNYEPAARMSMELYLAATTRKNWPNTRVPRSSMPVFTALSQIEAMLPHVDQALFGSGLQFACAPFPGTHPAEARAVETLLRWQLMFLDPDSVVVPHTSLREIFRQGYKSDLIFGNQIVEFGWKATQRQRTRYDRSLIRQFRTVMSLMGPQQIPTGSSWQVTERPYTESISKPFARHTANQDFYWDPTCPSHNIQKGRYACVRQRPTVAELLSLADNPGFTIPSRSVLVEAAKRKTTRPADSSLQLAEAARSRSYIPASEYNENPDLCRIDVVRYHQADRIVWIALGCDDIPELKNQPLYNAPNEYLMLPFLTSAYIDVPNRFEGMSLCALVEGDQKLAMEILDARIDELSLTLRAPIVRNKQMMAAVPPSQRRFHPGAEWEVDGDVNQAVKRLELGSPATSQAFVELDAIDRRVQKATGNSDLTVIGTPSAGGNSANRTAAGIQSQQVASNTRIQYQVVNLEDHILTPLLYAIHHLDSRFLDPSVVQEVLGPDGSQTWIANADVVNAECMFEVQASQKMRARQSLAAGGLQTILEQAINPQLVGQMAEAGLKPNMPEIDALVCDTMGLPPKSLWVPMTPEEIQQRQQQSQQSDMIRLQMQRERLAAAASNQADSNETKVITSLINKLETPDVVHKQLGLPSPAEIAAAAAPTPPSGGGD